MFLRNLWYYALPGTRLKAGRMTSKTLLGEPVLLGRDAAGQPFALRDICPHRGIPLSYGSFDGREVECCYHGWRFGTDGVCTAIPSLVEGQKFDVSKVGVHSYPCREVQGNVWVFFADGAGGAGGDAAGDPEGADDLPAIPEVPDFAGKPFDMVETMAFPCHVDHAVVGLMDPSHGPFVHRSWWWRSAKSIHAKEKRFVPSELGFTMARHRPSRNSKAYKILGGVPETEIRFQLPGVRVEHTTAGRHSVCNLTAVTPVDENNTIVNHAIYWTVGWASAIRPLLQPFARNFLRQDRDIVVRQQEGLRHDPNLMLINDSDTQAKWYYRLKKEWQRMSDDGGPFVNPVQETVLRWRS